MSVSDIINQESFWVACASVGFVALIFNKVKISVNHALDKRAFLIESDLKHSEKLKSDAKNLLNKYTKQSLALEAEIQKIMFDAETTVKHIAENSKRDLESSLIKKTNMAMQRIAAYETSVMNDMRTNAVEIAIKAVKDIVQDNIKQDLPDDVVDSVISEISRNTH
jgi:F-type H+-transporting ATPase subunit b